MLLRLWARGHYACGKETSKVAYSVLGPLLWQSMVRQIPPEHLDDGSLPQLGECTFICERTDWLYKGATYRQSLRCMHPYGCLHRGRARSVLLGESERPPMCRSPSHPTVCYWVLECQLNIAQEGGAIAANRVYIPCMTHENAAAKPLKVKSPMQ